MQEQAAVQGQRLARVLAPEPVSGEAQTGAGNMSLDQGAQGLWAVRPDIPFCNECSEERTCSRNREHSNNPSCLG